MYEDGGYGNNWQPAANTARRIDPYTRSCAVLGGLFAIGFVLIIIIVLSLIPIYISHNSSKTMANNIQVASIGITGYKLQLESPFQDFDVETILSEADNLQTLQAALTSILQKDNIMSGSVVEIDSVPADAGRKRRQTSDLLTLTFDFDIISNKSCALITNSNSLQTRLNTLLSSVNKVIPIARYQQSNTSEVYYLSYQLPQTLQAGVSCVSVDPTTMSSLLQALVVIQQTQNQPPVETSTSSVVG